MTSGGSGSSGKRWRYEQATYDGDSDFSRSCIVVESKFWGWRVPNTGAKSTNTDTDTVTGDTARHLEHVATTLGRT